MSQSFVLWLALVTYAVIFAVFVHPIVSNAMTPWLNSLVGWPPEIERLDGYLVYSPVVATRPMWVRAVMVATSGIISVPFTLVALKWMLGGKHE